MRWIAVSILFSLALLTGCGGGGGGSTSTNSPSTPSNSGVSSGNWSLAAASSVVAGKTYIGGSLLQSGTSLSAIMHIDGSSCYDLLTNIPFTGSVTGTNFTLTSSSINSQVITVTGTIANSSSIQGSYTITGGCATGDKGTVTGVLVPSISGTWKATDMSTGVTITITGNIIQSTSATSDGLFLLSGNFTYANSPCSTGGTIKSASFIAGDVVAVDANTNDKNGTTGETQFIAFLDSPTTPTSFTGDYQIVSGYCTGETGTLKFVKQ